MRTFPFRGTLTFVVCAAAVGAAVPAVGDTTPPTEPPVDFATAMARARAQRTLPAPPASPQQAELSTAAPNESSANRGRHCERTATGGTRCTSSSHSGGPEGEATARQLEEDVNRQLDRLSQPN